MKTMMKTLLVTAALWMTHAPAEELFEKIATETGDYCTDQALGHMRYLFGEDIKVKKVFSESAGDKTAYWFETNFCDGHLVAMFMKGSSCGTVHYGSVPLYMQRLYAHGNCQHMMSADSYPALDTTFPFIVA